MEEKRIGVQLVWMATKNHVLPDFVTLLMAFVCPYLGLCVVLYLFYLSTVLQSYYNIHVRTCYLS